MLELIEQRIKPVTYVVVQVKRDSHLTVNIPMRLNIIEVISREISFCSCLNNSMSSLAC